MCIDKKKKLEELIHNYKISFANCERRNVAEETIRIWINDFLRIFGWDVHDNSKVLQESTLNGSYANRLREIDSNHRKPDYTLVNGANIKTFVDAKKLSVNILKDKSIAFQIRSYGWSAQVPCCFVTNFEQIVVYDTTFMPNFEMEPDFGTTVINIDDYIEKFDLLDKLFSYDLICNGSLLNIFNKQSNEGNYKLDDNFAKLLSNHREKIANSLFTKNEFLKKDEMKLNYYTQLILDRIFFIRVCESKGLEAQDTLLNIVNDLHNTWDSLKEAFFVKFYNRYDGPMFFYDDEFENLKIDNEILANFISSLYYPSPYKFDVISINVIANIYDEFLGKKICIQDGKVLLKIKDEYTKTNGAVTTPESIVGLITNLTFDLNKIDSVKLLFNTKILDPCCGSGIFLIIAFDILSEKLLNILTSDTSERETYSQFVYEVDNTFYLTVKAKRAVFSNCLFGIDWDSSAIEVAKMSFALKIIDSPFVGPQSGLFGEKILQDVSRNIALGNTLVEFLDSDLPYDDLLIIKPFSVKHRFKDVFDNYGGFDYIICNPPYVETKHFKNAYPIMHEYLKNNYKSFNGKADLSILFIERCLSFINDTGKIGMIVQNRWFRTKYGINIRQLIIDEHCLQKIIEFGSTSLFKNHTTYVSALILSKTKNNFFEYSYSNKTIEDLNNDFQNKIYNYEFIELALPNRGETWQFRYCEITKIKTKLNKKFGTITDFPGLLIKDGIQVLWKKCYHIINFIDDGFYIKGINGFGEKVTVEKSICKAVIYNKEFYPFKDIKPDAYCIFPYEDDFVTPIEPKSLERCYPHAYKYLTNKEELIKDNVKFFDDDLWYRYKRVQNHQYYNVKKIIIPMTSRDTVSSVAFCDGIFTDNSNVWFICLESNDNNCLKTISSIVNSTLFSVLAKSGANPQDNGYFKFNKQFLESLPFPSLKILNDKTISDELVKFYDEISKLQMQYVNAPLSLKETIGYLVDSLWDKLDEFVYGLYDLNNEDISIVESIGRTLDRKSLIR